MTGRLISPSEIPDTGSQEAYNTSLMENTDRLLRNVGTSNLRFRVDNPFQAKVRNQYYLPFLLENQQTTFIITTSFTVTSSFTLHSLYFYTLNFFLSNI